MGCDCQKYKGWANYETWATKLWLDNDEGLYREVQRMTRRADDMDELAGQIRVFVEDLMPDLEGLAADLLRIDVVDWDEIAKATWEDEGRDAEEDAE